MNSVLRCLLLWYWVLWRVHVPGNEASLLENSNSVKKHLSDFNSQDALLWTPNRRGFVTLKNPLTKLYEPPEGSSLGDNNRFWEEPRLTQQMWPRGHINRVDVAAIHSSKPDARGTTWYIDICLEWVISSVEACRQAYAITETVPETRIILCHVTFVVF